MNAAGNIIRKQSVHFTYSGKTDAFALQKEVSDWCTLSLIPEIEQILESFALGDQYITIEKIDIDAAVNNKDWKQKIKDELLFGLNRKLSNYKNLYQEAAVKRETVLQKLDELILYYFEKGYLPWWSRTFITNNFETVLHNWATEDIQPARAENIGLLLQKIVSKTVVERIQNRLPGRLFFQFLKNIYKNEIELLNQAERFFKEIIPGTITVAKQKAIAKAVYEYILILMMKSAGKLNTDLMLQLFYEELKKYKDTAHILIPASVTTGKVITPVELAWQQLLINENISAQKKIDDPVKTESKLKYNKAIDKLTGKTVAANSKAGVAEALQEGIFIENAGAVIIAAFLPALFEKLKLLRSGTIENTGLAALIIQYSVTGNAKMEEYELVLPKILCGIDLELPVNTNKKITAAQKREADEMLLSVIEYWAVIKNTSINGLRESFLKRNGKISLVNNEWLLQVEQKSFDMLLQQLPWSISMIRLPWMKNLLKTEWI